MKINLPVTQSEVAYPKGRYLVSKTDLKGIITHANDAFVDLSGYCRSELIGNSHNMVRHPDMPPEAFADLWHTVKNGLPWHGVVKNRAKNGDHYWVQAFVVPVRKQGQTVGYMSVRTEPSRAAVREADELYRRVRDKQAKLQTVNPGVLGRFSFSTRLWTIMGGMAALTAGITVASFAGQLTADRALIVGVAALVSTLIAISVGVYLSLRIDRPLSKVAEFFDQIAEGNLTNDVDVSKRDETGVLFCQLGGMQVHLLAMLDNISSAASVIENRCQNLDRQMAQVNEQSALQYDSAKSVAAATEELSVSVREVASSANDTTAAAQLAQQLIKAGNEQIRETVQMTTRVVDAVERSSATINVLSAAIHKIDSITQAITDIAGQTNLLALNAAIEAARAGEQGRGFAVVADEVRTLAERTSSSTRDIASTIAEIQSVTAEAVEAMASARKEVVATTASLQNNAESLDGVTQAASEVARMSQSISEATVEQTQASEDVAQNMERITQLIEGNLQAAQLAKQSSNELLDTSSSLKDLIGEFQIHKN
ncbi:PAS domain-containing methyl-accepting chemotaxis protein [Dechloromonas agitata]|uniref:methyl-accepting chemotaxis protein n=1 Tax=Dechloromonas agitata TaxID=73030 RepID=UPI00237D65EF|nr:PAS domain-containing methyl-accepting chemotaxis protein [Dechloromonas agitata]MDE1543997.1 PAS domain-containing methyl-accepting chemotaxis protein [Dechloromonas agitata]